MALLRNKTAIVTGGAGSIGLAVARLFLAEGANIVLVDNDRAALERAVAGLPKERVACAAADVTDNISTQAYIGLAVERFGGIDVLFSNAGTFGTVAPIADYPLDIFDAVQAVHVRGAFLAAKHAVPHMRDGGSIIITSSVAATRGDPGVYAYITAKHAQTGLMRCLAKELAPRGIRVNTVNPDAVLRGSKIWNGEWREQRAASSKIEVTDLEEHYRKRSMLKLNVFPEDIAEAIYFLASDASAKSTGNIINVDAGNAQSFTR